VTWRADLGAADVDRLVEVTETTSWLLSYGQLRGGAGQTGRKIVPRSAVALVRCPSPTAVGGKSLHAGVG
jgi:hypothetical protein